MTVKTLKKLLLYWEIKKKCESIMIKKINKKAETGEEHSRLAEP